MTRTPPTIAVATPTRGLVHSRTVEAVLVALDAAEAQNAVQRVDDWWQFAHGKPIPDAHEQATEMAYKTGADLIWFVEDDNVPPPDALVASVARMQATKAGLVTVPYPVGVSGTKWNSVYREHGKIRFTGLGITLLDRKVFDKLPKPWFTIDRRHGPVPDGKGGTRLGLINRPMPEGHGGVDVVFCLRVGELGFKLEAVENMVGGHLRLRKLGSHAGSGVNNSPHVIDVWNTIDSDQFLPRRGDDGTRFRPPARELARKFRQLAPWVSGFEIDGQHYGGSYDPIHDPRLVECRRRFPDVGTILELGALEGGHTVGLSLWAEHIVAVEGRAANVAKAKLVLQTHGVTNAELVQGNLETMNLAKLGPFDLVFCVGVLYHLPEPLKLLDEMAKAAPRLFLWTHHGGAKEKAYNEFGLKDPLSGLSSTSKWLSRAALLSELRKRYHRVEVLEDEADHKGAGPAVLVAAER